MGRTARSVSGSETSGGRPPQFEGECPGQALMRASPAPRAGYSVTNLSPPEIASDGPVSSHSKMSSRSYQKPSCWGVLHLNPKQKSSHSESSQVGSSQKDSATIQTSHFSEPLYHFASADMTPVSR